MMKYSACFLLLAAALIGYASADLESRLREGQQASRVARQAPCTHGCSTVVVGDGLDVPAGSYGDNDRVITNQGSWGSGSGYQPAGNYRQNGYRPRGNYGGNGYNDNYGGNPSSGYENGYNNGYGNGYGQPNDVRLSQPCYNCALDVRGSGNVVRN